MPVALAVFAISMFGAHWENAAGPRGTRRPCRYPVGAFAHPPRGRFDDSPAALSPAGPGLLRPGAVGRRPLEGRCRAPLSALSRAIRSRRSRYAAYAEFVGRNLRGGGAAGRGHRQRPEFSAATASLYLRPWRATASLPGGSGRAGPSPTFPWPCREPAQAGRTGALPGGSRGPAELSDFGQVLLVGTLGSRPSAAERRTSRHT